MLYLASLHLLLIHGLKINQGHAKKNEEMDWGRQNDEKMSRKTRNEQSRATFFRQCPIRSLPVALLRKVPNIEVNVREILNGFS